MNSIVDLLEASWREKAQEFAGAKEKRQWKKKKKKDPMRTTRVDNCNYIDTAI